MKVSKGIYILLALILGGIGAHKFYANKWFQGLLYLGFCWTGLPLLLSVLDLLVAIFKRADRYGQISV